MGRIGMKFAHGANEVDAVRIALVPMLFQHPRELDGGEHRVVAVGARYRPSMAVGAVDPAETITQVAATIPAKTILAINLPVRAPW